VARADDPAALTAALDTLLADPHLSASLGAAGKTRALAFDIDAIADAYTELFLEQASRSLHPIEPQEPAGIEDSARLGAFA